MGTGERNPHKGKKRRLWRCTGFDLGSLSCRLQPWCHAAFYNSDLCWANVQIAFLSAIASVWAFKPERSQHRRDCGADLQRHCFASVTATCQLPLPLHTFQSEVQQQGWQIPRASCPTLPSSVFPGSRAQLGRVNTCQPNLWKFKVQKIIWTKKKKKKSKNRWGHVNVVFPYISLEGEEGDAVTWAGVAVSEGEALADKADWVLIIKNTQ